ncbi:MAG TPA: hypothetical protein VJ912_04070 [Candidatus Nanoarchaeia archaeon]|nr:hypothetical protein [Candidatus Nanoarchaeia archaeon]
MKRGQGAIEFIVVIGLVLGFLALFISSIYVHQFEKTEQKENKQMQQIAYNVKNEIQIASETLDGYERNFTIPRKIMGNNYTMKIINDYLQIETQSQAFSVKIKKINGELKRGVNTIKRKNGEIYINE